MPTAALLPGEYLVNAAYGLSNLTKKVKVESGKSIEETFVLNTGALARAGRFRTAIRAGGKRPLRHSLRRGGSIRQSPQDPRQREADVVIRLNAGAYHIVSLYGDANASVKCDVTVEPGGHRGDHQAYRRQGHLQAGAELRRRGARQHQMEDPHLGRRRGEVERGGAAHPYSRHRQLCRGRRPRRPGLHPEILHRARRRQADRGGHRRRADLAGGAESLLDPPEPPAPGTGTLAGEGGGGAVGFDGFSTRPADPNAPLLNPGTLLRPSAQ